MRFLIRGGLWSLIVSVSEPVSRRGGGGVLRLLMMKRLSHGLLSSKCLDDSGLKLVRRHPRRGRRACVGRCRKATRSTVVDSTGWAFLGAGENVGALMTDRFFARDGLGVNIVGTNRGETCQHTTSNVSSQSFSCSRGLHNIHNEFSSYSEVGKNCGHLSEVSLQVVVQKAKVRFLVSP